jgi:hypothetical protein
MGKVHGSLARAGKVKAQTPKVCRLSRLDGHTYEEEEEHLAKWSSEVAIEARMVTLGRKRRTWRNVKKGNSEQTLTDHE